MAHACVASQALVTSVAARVRGSAKLGDATRRRFAPRASASFSRARRAVLARASDEASATADEGPPDESQFGAEPWSGPGEDPISNEVLLKIVLSQIPDDEVNRLVWECLGCVPRARPPLRLRPISRALILSMNE